MDIDTQLQAIGNTSLSDTQGVMNAGRELEQLFLSASPEKITQALSDQEMAGMVREVYKEYETSVERNLARATIAGEDPNPRDYFPLWDEFEKMVDAEIELAKVTESDRILLVGCGPYPMTALYGHSQTNAQYLCIDKDKKSAETASQVVSTLGLQDAISVESGPGEELKQNDFSLAIVTLLVSPKEEVLKQLFTHKKDDARVVVRTAKGALEALYPSAASVLEGYTITEESLYSVLLEEKVL